MEYLAHIRESDGKEQTLREHSDHVSILCGRFAQAVGLSKLAELIGLLHDMGKGTADFIRYLQQSAGVAPDGTQGKLRHHNHAPTGAIYVYERWFLTGKTKIQRYTAQLISLCIYGHHSGLIDCIDDDIITCNFQKRMEQDKKELKYQEAVSCFLMQICSEAELDRKFEQACQEIQEKWSCLCLTNNSQEKDRSRHSFQQGMLVRLLLSMLVDADRWDSACFEFDRDPLARPYPEPDWGNLLTIYETFVAQTFTDTKPLNRIRREISDRCFVKAEGSPGIYRLTVPTGGGKTYSSLRFALRHAGENGQKRIFYIIPYNTILDQNARDIRKALDYYDRILEHHSNVVMENESECAHYKHLTERWDSDIILTSMVQFLNALFRKENANARRMHQLTDAVLIFDEIQALPRRCKGLFERAISFLTSCCHTTVLLCTATQMEFQLPGDPIELMGTQENIRELNCSLRRVTYIPEIGCQKNNEEAAEGLFSLIQEKRSVLVIVNTKLTAKNIYDRTCDRLINAGYERIEPIAGLPPKVIQDMAGNSESWQILCIHLSTLLCPAHRMEYIKWVKNWTEAGGNTLCVSTALIEAGINVSFPVVVRSLTGLPGIVQAAGRCNRNKELENGDVYIWNFSEEKLTNLPEISDGQMISRNIIGRITDHNFDKLSTSECIREYFMREHQYLKGKEEYPLGNTSIVELLSQNRQRAKYFYKEFPLCQSFRKAGEAFCVIEQLTKSILVPYGEGEQIIAELNGRHALEEEIRLLQKAQRYSVSVYDCVWKRLEKECALFQVGESGVVALQPGFYSNESGLMAEQGELEVMII